MTTFRCHGTYPSCSIFSPSFALTTTTSFNPLSIQRLGAPTLSSSSQGYGQHDPSSHYGSYQQQQQQSQPYQYYTDQQQQQPSYPYYGLPSGGSTMMTSAPSYSSPTHVHTSLSSSPSPVSGSQGLGPIGALLSPKADLAGQDSHNHISGSNQPYQYHAAGADTKDISRTASTKKPRSLSSPTSTFSSFTSGASTTSIHAIASATATNARGGTTAIAANMSPPSSMSSPSAASPPSSVSSPTSPKKKGSQTPKKSPALPMGIDNAPPKSPKPAQSYSFLITTAILESLNKQLTLNEIYEWVMEHHPWYRNANNGWKVNCVLSRAHSHWLCAPFFCSRSPLRRTIPAFCFRCNFISSVHCSLPRLLQGFPLDTTSGAFCVCVLALYSDGSNYSPLGQNPNLCLCLATWEAPAESWWECSQKGKRESFLTPFGYTVANPMDTLCHPLELDSPQLVPE